MSCKVEPGIHSLAAEHYLSAEGVSKSMLDILSAKTPAHLKAYLDGECVKEETDAMRFGTIMHRALLEPDTYKDGFYVRPEGIKLSTKAGIEWKLEHADKPSLASAEASQIDRMVYAVYTHPFAKRLLTGAIYEQSIFVQDSMGTLRKSRLDALTKGNVLPDLKTCETASTESFERSVSRYRYHVQAAYYLDNCNLAGIEKDAFFFVCVEKSSPYAVRCLQLDGDAISYGKLIYERDLQTYRNCLETGEWPAWETGYGEVALPAYEMRQMEAVY